MQFTKRKPKGATIAQKRGAIVGPEELTRTLATLPKLPFESNESNKSWIGANPRNIVQIASLEKEKGTGFNEIAWRDKGGSKLYLENLDSLGAINEESKVTYPQVKSLANASHWENPLPDTIVVKSAGSQQIRMAAKKMVLGLLDSYQSDLTPPNKPVLKETKTDNPGLGEFAIQFSVKGITQIEPIMRLDTYMLNYSHLFSDTLLGALKTYQDNLKAGVVNGFRVEEVAKTQGGAAGKMFQDIGDAADDLQKALKTEIAKNKEKTKVTAGPGLDTLKKSLATLRSMQTQVESALEDGFKNEFDTRRWQQWRALKPLTEDVIVPGTGEPTGAGVQGTVFKYELDPAMERRPVVLKYDRNGLNENATKAGIPELNPQQSVRAVAAFKMSKQLNLDIIPQTEFFVGTDADGRPELGQAMQVVNGAIGQRTAYKNVPVNQKEIQDAQDIVNNPPRNLHPLDLAGYQNIVSKHKKENGTWYPALDTPVPVDIDYNNRFVQKGLSDLQVFDYIIGHADRNPGNWFYEKQGDTIIGVKGIDNDDTFGEQWSPEGAPRMGFPIRGIPPIVDISTALSILNANFEAIRPLLAGLSGEEINKAAERFAQVQQEVGRRVMAGNIASMGDVDPATLQQLRDKVQVMGPMPAILRWGNPGIAGDHTGQNSYLGYMTEQINKIAQTYGGRGVVQESGMAFY
jgi:hypothetical protein